MLLAALLLALPVAAQELVWDSQGVARGLNWSSLAEVDGQPAIAFFDATLNYARFDGAEWQVTVVDPNNGTGEFSSLALINGQPAISYHDSINSALKYAHFDGSAWQVETVDNSGAVGQFNSLALINGQPAISYFDDDNESLKYARFDGTTWQIETVDDRAGALLGQFSSLAEVGGQPAISYRGAEIGLQYARFDGAAWQFTTVDSTVSGWGYATSLAVTDAGPSISYVDVVGGKLLLATFDGAAWSTSTVDDSGDVGTNETSLVRLSSGFPAISYFDKTNGHLKYAAFDGSTWTITTIDSENDSGEYSSLALVGGRPAISYSYSNLPAPPPPPLIASTPFASITEIRFARLAQPGMTVSLSAAPAAVYIDDNAVVSYTYTVQNTGEISLTLDAQDSRVGPIALSVEGIPLGADAKLGPGRTATAVYTYTPVAGDLPGPIGNTVAVTGTHPGMNAPLVRYDNRFVTLLVRSAAQTMCYGNPLHVFIALGGVQPAVPAPQVDMVVIAGPAPQNLVMEGVQACVPYTGYKSMVELTNQLVTKDCAGDAACNTVNRLVFEPYASYRIETIQQVQAVFEHFLPMLIGDQDWIPTGRTTVRR